MRDITERKRMENALRESEGWYRVIFEQSQLGIAAVTVDEWRFVFPNPAFCRMFGYTEQELRQLTVKDITHPDDFDAELEAGTTDSGEAQNFVIQKRFISKAGKLLWGNVTASVLYDASGKPIYRVGMVENITARHNAEESLKQLNETLEQRVQEETEKNRQKEHLLIQQSRLAAMGEMIGNIAHQWRQPLNALTLVLANIEDAANHQELSPEYLENQTRNGERLIQKMSSTIDDFRHFFRPQKQQEPFSAIAAIEEARSLASASFHNNNIELRLETRDDVRIVGFANEFSQVLLNLLSNAKDAILSRHIQNGVVTIRLSSNKSRVTIQVIDNGGGIPATAMEHIFEPYFSTKELGTGIGLYMSKMIIETSMHGSILARNVDSGTEFTLTCPLDFPEQ
jgi:PAS domain S-box-containing protein